ncbi:MULTISPECIES: universal stress protein [unclassified Streptomyces]|uniref:universal stress protein n=2 Tax=Streptomyces TaxID=1883 RepID=UPI000DB92361|nr:universal stress protein [Streptomyces sp. PsTaAH-130]MYU07990.1 universal stress protein [Streptomyces sp. SID8366]RAJ59183.1 nucleotide-binding universal stress UspA family protein [Streptomyces sp. PsTaAH-130]
MSAAPVIAAVDGSEDSLRAMEWAADAARRRAAPLRVIHVRQYAAWGQTDVLVAGPPEEEEGDPVLDEVRARLADHAPETVEYIALEGAPGAVLPELGVDAQLMVLGSRGRGGFASLLLGSNSLAAARDAECPVVVVPPPEREVHGEGPAEPGPRVVVGVNVDSPDEATLDFAFTEAALRGARVQAIAAYPWPLQTWSAPGQLVPPMPDEEAIANETRALAEGFLAPHRERHPGVRADSEAVPGDAAGNLVAASRDAELVVVGRHRRRLLAPARMMGSVTQAVLLHAAAPVAVLAPTPGEE